MMKSRFGWSLIAPVLLLAVPLAAQQPRQSEIAAAAQIYGYNLADGNWAYSQARCGAMPGFIMLHYHRGYPDGAESNFTAIVPRSFGHVRIVPVLYHGATPFVPAPRNPRNFALFNSFAAPVPFGSSPEKLWLELASCYAEMTGGNDFLAISNAGPRIAGQPAPTVRVTVQGKTARVLFAERDSHYSYREWNLLFNRDGRIKSAQTQEQSVYAPSVARTTAPNGNPQMQRLKNAVTRAAALATGETAKESASRSAQISTSESQQRASIQAEQPTPFAPPVAAVALNPSDESLNAGSHAGWKLILNPPQPRSKFIPNAPAPLGTTVPNPPSSVR